MHPPLRDWLSHGENESSGEGCLIFRGAQLNKRGLFRGSLEFLGRDLASPRLRLHAVAACFFSVLLVGCGSGSSNTERITMLEGIPETQDDHGDHHDHTVPARQTAMQGTTSSTFDSPSQSEVSSFLNESDTAMQRIMSSTFNSPSKSAVSSYLGGLDFLMFWTEQPTLRIESSASDAERKMVLEAVDQINDWLPVDRRIRVSTAGASDVAVNTVENIRTSRSDLPDGTIHVSFRLPEEIGGSYSGSYIRLSSYYDDGSFASGSLVAIQRTGNETQMKTSVTRRLFQAMGLGWYSTVPGSILQGNRDGSLSLIDQHGLMANYTGYETWATSSPQLQGLMNLSDGTAAFGVVRHGNGFTRAWDSGPLPSSDLSGSGSASWSGAMVGYTDAAQGVTGDASLTVNLDSLSGSAAFSSITHRTDGTPWANGMDLTTGIDVSGNQVRSTAVDNNDNSWKGFDGAFRGNGHEAVTGAFRWENTTTTGNLTGAFGASRGNASNTAPAPRWTLFDDLPFLSPSKSAVSFYLNEIDNDGYAGLTIWTEQPTLRIESSASDAERKMVLEAVDQINDWLPVDRRIRVSTIGASNMMVDDVNARRVSLNDLPDGTTHVSFRLPDIDPSVPDRVGESMNDFDPYYLPKPPKLHVRASLVSIERIEDETWMKGTVIHELLHTMGLNGHSTVPGSILYVKDGHSSRSRSFSLIDQHGIMANYTGYGPWATSSPQLQGLMNLNNGTAAFGVVRHGNNFTRAWDSGPLPSSDLSGSGSASWSGAMVGYTDAAQGVTGDASLTVNLDSLSGSAAFSSITHRADGTPWANGMDLTTGIDVSGNRISSTAADDSWKGFDGTFRGNGHEAVTGAFRWENTTTGNLTGAFGASRD